MTTQTNKKIRLVRCPKCTVVLPEPDIPVYRCGGCGAVLQAKIRKTSTTSSHDGREPNGSSGEATGFAIGDSSSLSDSSSNRNEESGLSEGATVFARGELLSDSSRNEDIGQSEKATVVVREEPSSDWHSEKATVVVREEPSSDGHSEKATVVVREEPSSDSSRNEDCGQSEKVTVVVREESVSDSSRNEDSGQSEKVTVVIRDEPSSDSSSDRIMKGINQEATVVARGELSSDSGSERNGENGVNEETTDPGQEPLPGVGSTRSPDNGLNEDGNSERGEALPAVSIMRKEPGAEKLSPQLPNLPEISSHENQELTSESAQKMELVKSDYIAGESMRDLRNDSFISGRSFSDSFFSSRELFGHETEDSSAELEQNMTLRETKSTKKQIPHNSNLPENFTSSSTLVSSVPPSLVVDTKTPVGQDLRVQSFDYMRKESGSVDADENRSSGAISTDNADSDDQNLGGKLGFEDRQLSKSPTKRYYGHDGGASSYDGFEERISSRSAKPPRRKFKQANSNHANGLHREGGSRTNGSRADNHEMQYKSILGSGLNDTLSDESGVRHQARRHPVLPEKYRANDYLHAPRNYDRYGVNRMRDEAEEHNSNLVYLQSGQRKAFHVYPNPGLSDVPSYTEPGKMELLRVVNELKEELKRMHISNSKFPLTATREENYNPLYYDDHLTPVEETSSEMRFPRNHQRIAFSGDAADYNRHVDCGCRQCHPQDRHYSAQLPSHTYSSPRPYRSSEFSAWDRDAVYADQWSRDNGIRNLQMRERYQSMKRHVMPVAGGNPIISCYHCSELLHLPADFLVTGRRCHKLRCYACGKVLKFSLQSGRHIVPFVPDANAIAPPPSMVDGSVSGRFHRDVEPEPFSYDEYGISFERSISTEAEVHHVGKNNSRTRNMSSEDTVMSSKDRKMKSVEDPSAKKSKEQKKSSSQSKEVEENRGGSPLHRLMGYSSPSAVFKF